MCEQVGFQLDEDHADVARHRQQHLAEGFGTAFLAGVELQLVQFGEAVDQVRHRGAEALDQLRLGDAAVLDGVVQQGGHQRLDVELPLGALGRHRDRVGDVRFAAGADLAQVGLVGEAIGLAHLVDLGRVQVVEPRGQGGKARRSRIGRGGAGRIGLL